MKIFLNKVGIFICLLALPAYAIDVFLSTQLSNSKLFIHGETDIWNSLYKGKMNEDIVVYGSSRAMAHFDARMMQDSLRCQVYNIGIDGGRFEMEKLRHEILMKYNKKPKLILYSLDEFTLERQKKIYNSEQLLPFMLFNYQMENSIKDTKVFNKFDFYLPLVRYYGRGTTVNAAVKEFCCSTGKEVSERANNGYSPVVRAWNKDLTNAKKTIKTYHVKVDTKLYNQFKQILVSCAANRIKVILIYTPEYVEGQSFVSNRKEVIHLYQDLSKKLKIPFYDYSNDSLSYRRKYFYNSLHLNKDGAEIFTMRIIKDLKTQL